jgi:DNA modification methylase
MDWRHIIEITAACDSIYTEMKNLCVWNKASGGMGSLYRSKHELIFVYKNGRGQHINNVELGANGRYRTNVWDYPGVNSFGENRDDLKLHPTVKNVQMVADAIMDVTNRGDVVLDSFLGSGTTLLACERVGRICRGIEIEPKYIDVAILRWQKLTGKNALNVVSGRTYNELLLEVENG